jgi:hypothetical protein
MIRIEVKTTEVNSRSGNRKDGSGTWTIRTQDAWAHTADPNGKPRPYPERISLQLEDNQLPFALGIYELSPASIYVGEFGRLMMGRPQLTPVAAAKAVA